MATLVTGAPDTRTVNGKPLSSDVTLTATDVGAEPSGSSSAAITQHESKAGAHSIAGVNGLQAALDGKEPSGTAAAAVAAHKSGTDQHSISGVAGLQAALDSKEASGTASGLVTPLEARVVALEARKSTCLVNAAGTGAPHETVSAALPASVASNTRYVLANPFGINTPVICVSQIFLNGKWADPGWDGNTGTGSIAEGVRASFVQGEGVVVQTGRSGLAWDSVSLGGGHGYVGSVVTSAPCRVLVRRMDD